MVQLINTGDRAIEGLRLQLEYPASYLVEDKVVVPFEEAAVVISERPSASMHVGIERQVAVTGDTARVSYSLDRLRFKEPLVIPEALKIRHATATELKSDTF